MKFINLIFTTLLISCISNEKIIQQNEAYYFYFENNNSTMNYIYSQKKNRKKYFYNIEKASNLFFDAIKKDEKFNIKKIKAKDTIGLNVKTYDWLNKFDNSSRARFFNSKKRLFYIIEKDTLKNGLNLIEVKFIDEIE